MKPKRKGRMFWHALFQRCHVRLGDCQVGRRFAAITAGFNIKRDRLTICERTQARAFQRGDMYKNVVLSAFRRNEAVAVRSRMITFPLGDLRFSWQDRS